MKRFIEYLELGSADEKLVDKIMWAEILLFAATIIFSIAIAQTLAIFLVVSWFAKVIWMKDFVLKRTPFDIPFAVFIVARILSIVFSTEVNISIIALRTEIIFYGVFFALTHEFSVVDEKQLFLIFKILFVSAVIASLYGTAKVLFSFEQRATSTTSGYVTLGFYLSAVFSLTLVLGSIPELFKKRWVWFVTVVTIAMGILFTYNRIHWGIILLSVVLIGIYREKKVFYASLALGGGTFLLFPTLSKRLYEMINFTSHMSGRDIIWKGAWQLMLHHPIFGFGVNTFSSIFPFFNEVPDKGIGSWHNDYIQIYMESGLVGLGALLWLIITIYTQGLSFLKDKKIPLHYKKLIEALLFSLTMCFLAAIVGGFFFDPLIALLFYLLLAMLGSIVAEKEVLTNSKH